MKNHHYFLLLIFFALLSSSCKHNLAPEVIKDTEKFDGYWNSLDSASKANLADQVSRKVFEEYLASDQFKTDTSRGVTAGEADALSENYYAWLRAQAGPGVSIDNIEKSIHFNAESLFNYLSIIRSKCASTGQVPGLRIYFARYNSLEPNPDKRDRMTVILRGTGDYLDLAHDPNDATNQNYVAWNYGDPCPPLCNKDENGRIQRCTDGRYQSGGHAVVLGCQ